MTTRPSPQPLFEVYVNHGRWVVECVCKNAETLIEDFTAPVIDIGAKPQPRVWHCTHCGTIHTIDFPPNRNAIEVQLAKRPEMRNRNWMPWESPGDLAAENALYLNEKSA